MIFNTKTHKVLFDVIGYEFPYNPNGHESDNNWLITKIEVEELTTNKTILSITEPCIQTTELTELFNYLRKEKPFVLYTLEQRIHFKLNNNKQLFIFIGIDMDKEIKLEVDLDWLCIKDILEEIKTISKMYPKR